METPKFKDISNEPASAEMLCEKLDQYAADIRRGRISPMTSFQEYVELYCGWTLTNDENPNRMAIAKEMESARNLIMGIGCVPDSESHRKAQKWLERNFPHYV